MYISYEFGRVEFFFYPRFFLTCDVLSAFASLAVIVCALNCIHTWRIFAAMTMLPLVQSIDDAFFERDVEMLELAFEGQMHFGCFYAYVKLKEQVQHALGWCVY